MNHKLFCCCVFVLGTACAGPRNRYFGSRAEHVRAFLESTRVEKPPIYFLEEQEPGKEGLMGLTTADQIRITPFGQDYMDSVVLHELTHWYLRGSPFDSVPLVVEEGIACWVERHLEPRHLAPGGSERGYPHGSPHGELGEQDLRLTNEQYLQLGGEEVLRVQAAALAYVESVGFARIKELAARGATTREYLSAFEDAKTSSEGLAGKTLEIIWTDADGTPIRTDRWDLSESQAFHGPVPRGARNRTVRLVRDE